ncbi:MAG: hypothetical protein ACOWWR_00645 [Eubacteriales bacterium]
MNKYVIRKGGIMKFLKEAFTYKEGVISFAVIILGILICYVGGNFITSEEISFVVVVVGGFISISGSTEFAKVLTTIRNMNNDENKK